MGKIKKPKDFGISDRYGDSLVFEINVDENVLDICLHEGYSKREDSPFLYFPKAKDTRTLAAKLIRAAEYLEQSE